MESNMLRNQFDALRVAMKTLAEQIIEVKLSCQTPDGLPDTSYKGEVIANLMLSYRHMEDASMRIGKAIQAYEGGRSVYDNKPTGAVKTPIGE